MKMNYVMTETGVTVKVISQVELENGETEDKVICERSFATADVPAILADGEKLKSLAVYGLTKLLQDRTSQIKEPEEKFEAMGIYFDDFFSKGNWKAPSEGGSRKAAVDPFFAQAVAELKDWSLTQATATIQALDKDTRATLRSAEAVAAKITELKKEASEVDVEGLMASLGGIPAEKKESAE